MSDDLVKRLRDGCSCNIDSNPCMAEEECRDAYAAADRIEELKAKLAQQDDLLQAAVAAALRAAVDEINCGCRIDKGGCGYPHACPQEDVASILALITPDAQAALDRYVKERNDEVVAAERERCARVVDHLENVLDALGFLTGGDYELEGWGISQEEGAEIRKDLAAIRKGSNERSEGGE